MMWIPLPLVALGALVAPSLRLCAAAHSSPLLLLTPGDPQASLAVSHDQSTSRWMAESSRGGILVVQATSATVAVPNVGVADLSSIRATWASASAPTSPTFHRLFGAAAPSSLPFFFSAGGHMRVTTKSSEGTNGLTEANDLVRALLQAAPQPLLRLLPRFNGQDGASVLARSLCASTGFTRHKASEQEACFSASFQLAHAKVEELFPFHAPLPGALPLLTALVLRPSPTDKATLTLDMVTASLTSLTALDSSAFSMANALTPRVMVVKQMDRESSVVSVVSAADARETPQRIPRESATTASDISVAVFGEGFHRRVRVALAPTTKLCPGHETSKGKVLLVVPLSTSVYADLDELRRMERFGEVKLYAPTKHIEIERPTAVSSQHVIALEFPIDSAQLTHTLEFPIHLRYQSPSNSSFYASAVLVAPEVFVSCESDVASEPSSYDGPLESLFSQWIHDAAWESTNWRRVAPPSPLTAVTVPVPVGFTPHGPLVSAITFSVTSLGALVLVYVAWKTPNRVSKNSAWMWKPKTP